MTTPLLPVPIFRAFDSANLPLAGGLLYTYSANTLTPKNTYSSADFSTPNSNPVVLDSTGSAIVRLIGSDAYKFVLKDSSGTTQWTIDYYQSSYLTGADIVALLTRTDIGGLLYPQTTEELAAAVTPTLYYYPPGDVRRYGAIGDGATDCTTFLQNAISTTHALWIPNGTYKITDSLELLDDTVLRLESRAAIIKGALTKAMVIGENPTSVRHYRQQIYSGTFDNTAKTNAGGIALDFKSLTMVKVFGTLIQNVETAVKNGGASSLGAFYNEFHGVDITTVVTGYSNGTLGNENKVFGGRVNDCTTGTIDDNNSCNSYFGLAVEVFTTGHSVGPSNASLLTRFIGSRLENAPTSGTGVLIGANAQDTLVQSPYLVGVTTDITDSGLRTTLLMPRGAASTPLLKFNGGTGIKSHFHTTVTRDVASLGAATFRQDGPITVSGISVGDAVTVTLPAAWPNNIIVGVPIVTATDTLYLPMYNPSGGAVDPASGDFQFDIWHH